MLEEKLIDQSYWTQKSIRDINLANRIAELLINRDDEFIPTALYGGKLTKHRNEKINKDGIGIFIECLMNPEVTCIGLTNRDRKKRDFIFGFTISILNNFSVFSFGVTDNYFIDSTRILKYISIGKELSKLIEPMYGAIHDIGDRSRLREKRSGIYISSPGIDIFKELPGAFWGNYFGKYYIDKIGKEKLLSFKAYSNEELENGDILIFTSPSPLTFNSPEDRAAQKQLRKYLNL